MINQLEKCEEFSFLHQQDRAFVIPNPWDIGSARLLQGLGYKALATTSSGLAYILGRTDGNVTLEETLTHCTELAKSTNIPISADFENGFSDDPETVSKNVYALFDTGIAGCSIEDFNPDKETIYDFNLAVERVQAAVEIVATLAMPFQLTARAENLIRGVNDIEDTIKRLKAFESVGANVLYAPGVNSLMQLREFTTELQAPFNVLAPFIKGASVTEFSDAGAARISIGGALNMVSVNPILKAGNEMLLEGTFDWVNESAPRNTVNKLLTS
jgi:2-methylisocitrate lyase-like PEP mutase family enzyme